MCQKRIAFINITVCLLFVVFAVIAAQFMPAGNVGCTSAGDIEQVYDEDWAFFLINEQNPLPRDYKPELKNITGKFSLDARCADYAAAMLLAAYNDGVRLRVVSAYRTMQKQGENFNNYVERLISENYSESEAIALTAAQIAMPGASEHNAGLAIDLLSIYCTLIDEEFDRTPEFRWLAENSWRFGFILRYPKGAQEITGFIYEPWHFRFVGIKRAEQIYNSGLTLEEYIESLSQYKKTSE